MTIYADSSDHNHFGALMTGNILDCNLEDLPLPAFARQDTFKSLAYYL